MREIKFRVPHYRTDNGIFDHFSYWGRGIHGSEFCSPSNTNWTTPRNDEQFLGLKDKNGREVYDNDIGRRVVEKDNFNPGGGMGQPRHDQPATKRWKEEEVRMIHIADDGARLFGHESLSQWSMREIEIIGNLHENPDLLK